MKKKLLFIGIIITVTVTLLSTKLDTDSKKISNQLTLRESPKIVYIQPLGSVKDEHLKVVKKSVESFYGYTCIIKSKKDLTDDLLTKSKSRYSANKILKKFNSNENLLIVTEKDIATPLRGFPEWGVLGLGYRPGKTCVVSTFRMKRNVSENVIIDRIKKVSLHEVGHNLGLDHCTYHPECMMNDAKGTIKQVDREKIWLCNKCKNQIGLH